MTEYVHIGKLVATFGVAGEVIVVHALGRTQFKDVEALFIEEKKGSYLPYFITAVKPKGTEELLFMLDGITSKEAAHKLLAKNVWLLQADFAKVVNKNSPISLLGYLVYNEGEPVGKVNEVIEQPHQTLLQVNLNGKEALLPLHDETLDRIDRDKFEVFLNLPEGLLDIYREG
ncbi:ribosome maturation factor RimM [Deminuibacter soli]|uniref:Ribosome maturation factor RimM n=1 Tax=Deminuibacter soli TaxID=2291815 RepID=A0A3E1NP84_9BACT|nr:16S rRNA processing protein RimM [Deminuibacter soli]RFM29634.1 16S rRNA processing protein RimM [Deminuibacter soli]